MLNGDFFPLHIPLSCPCCVTYLKHHAVLASHLFDMSSELACGLSTLQLHSFQFLSPNYHREYKKNKIPTWRDEKMCLTLQQQPKMKLRGRWRRAGVNWLTGLHHCSSCRCTDADSWEQIYLILVGSFPQHFCDRVQGRTIRTTPVCLGRGPSGLLRCL